MDKALFKIISGFILIISGIAIPIDSDIRLWIFLLAYIILGIDVLIKAVKNLFIGKILDENLLMSIATIGAFILKDYPEGVAVMLFYQVGELFQDYATDKSKKSIEKLLDIRPDYANLMVNDKPERVSPDKVNIGDTIMIKPGERVPLDSIIINGVSSIDNSALTGESTPKSVKSGDTILSGCINLSGVLLAKVSSTFGKSTISRILDLVQQATEKKAHTEKFITRFAKYYTPIIICVALIISLIPPIFFDEIPRSEWIYRALVFLVISCPCALVISIPLSFFCGIGKASKHGILVKGSNYIEGLAAASSVVFDKTGTLTNGTFTVVKIRPVGMDRDKFLEIAAHAEIHSSHPIALSIKSAFHKPLQNSRVANIEEISGCGIKALVDEKEVFIGNCKLMNRIGDKYPNVSAVGSIIHMNYDGKYAGYAIVSDKIKSDAPLAIQKLRELGIDKIAMLTGDSKSIGDSVAQSLNLDYAASDLLPMDKLEEVNKLSEDIDDGYTLVFVGDGINDAPVLAQADIGIAMGGLGSDIAVETADVVIMDDKPSKVADAIVISRKTMSISKQNIVFSLGIKCAILLLGIFGLSSMWGAVFADVGVSMIVILNSMRIMKLK